MLVGVAVASGHLARRRRTTTVSNPTSPAAAPTGLSWFARRRRAATDAAALRTHDQLLAGGLSAARSSGSRALTAFSVIVVTVALAVLVLLVWVTALPKGLWGWAGVAVGWILVAALVPRPAGGGDAQGPGAA